MLLLSYSVSLLLGLCVAVAEKQANILFIVADDLGALTVIVLNMNLFYVVLKML